MSSGSSPPVTAPPGGASTTILSTNPPGIAIPGTGGTAPTSPAVTATIHTFPLSLTAVQTIQQNQTEYTYLSGSLTPRGQQITTVRLGDVNDASDDKRYVLKVVITNTQANIVQGDLACPSVTASSSTGGGGLSALQGQSATYFAIDPTVPNFDVNNITALLHPAEIASLKSALDLLNSNSNSNSNPKVHAVALDVLERDQQGSIKSPPQTHAVVLWKNKRAPAGPTITLIDPSKTTFSQSLLDYITDPSNSNTLLGNSFNGAIVIGKVLYGRGNKAPPNHKDHKDIGLVTDANPLQQVQQVQPPDLSLVARDCIDIAIKLIYEIEIQEAYSSGGALDIQTIIKTITNQPNAYHGQTSVTSATLLTKKHLSKPEAQNSGPVIRSHEAQERAAGPKQSAKGTKKTASTSSTATSSSAPGTAAPSGATTSNIPAGA